MPNYKRAFIPGGTWFFTVNLLQRHHNDLLIREISLLREMVKRARERHPFQIDAWVVLPEHLHSTACATICSCNICIHHIPMDYAGGRASQGAVAERVDLATRR